MQNAQKSGETKAPRIAAFLFAVALFAGCCGSFSDEEALRDQAARLWLHPWKEKYAWNQILGWKVVSNSRFPLAEGLLRDSAFVPLSRKQVNELLGYDFQVEVPGNSPYLLRGVGDGREKFPLELYVSARGDSGVWVGGGANNPCDVPMERRAVVVWLEKPPSSIYVTFVVGR